MMTRHDGASDAAEDARARRQKEDRQWPSYLRAWTFSAIAAACVIFAFSDGVLPLPGSRVDALPYYLIRGLILSRCVGPRVDALPCGLEESHCKCDSPT